MTTYDDYSWTVEPGTMTVLIKKNNTLVMKFFLGEAIELAGRKNVVKHVQACDNSQWLTNWQLEKQDQQIENTFNEIKQNPKFKSEIGF